jgi:hypothetical protein
MHVMRCGQQTRNGCCEVKQAQSHAAAAACLLHAHARVLLLLLDIILLIGPAAACML